MTVRASDFWLLLQKYAAVHRLLRGAKAKRQMLNSYLSQHVPATLQYCFHAVLTKADFVPGRSSAAFCDQEKQLQNMLSAAFISALQHACMQQIMMQHPNSPLL